MPEFERLERRLDQAVDRYERVEARLGAASDGAEITRLSQEHAELKPLVDAIRAVRAARAEIADLEALAADGSDREVKLMAEQELQQARERLPALQRAALLLLAPKDKDESASAILEVRAGTGGEEAALFAGDLFRMYQRYASQKRWRFEIESLSETGLGGLKEAVASISGPGVYGRLRFESGVHRVQRVPETEAGGRIHTSAATVAVLPFTSLTNQEEDAAFAAGLHDDLLNRLAQVGSLQVIGRTSVQSYQDTTLRIKQIAAQLDADIVLEGSVQRALVADPNNRLAQSLLKQIQADPLATLGRESFVYRVQPGESLSRIAQRFLGDIHQFYILARYNDIKVPRQLQGGQVIRIPGKAPPPPAPSPIKGPPTPPAPPPAASQADDGRAAQRERQTKINAATRAARVAFARQDLTNAIRNWDIVLELDPNNTNAQLERKKAVDLRDKLGKVK